MMCLTRALPLVIIYSILIGSCFGSAVSAPVNDNFQNKTKLTGVSGKVKTTNLEATAETDEPNHGDGGSTAYSSIWFSWSPSFTGHVFFDTFESLFDTTLAVYTGTSLASIVKLYSNDDAGSVTQSLVDFPVTAGTSYHLAVDGYDANEYGKVCLNWNPAADNDHFTNADIISGAQGTIRATNKYATTEPGEPNHGDGSSTSYSSIWFSWTAPSAGELFLNTYGTTFDTTLAAYTGASVNSLTKLAENDDAGTGEQSQINFSVTPGSTYFIAVDGFDKNEKGRILMSYNFIKNFPWPIFLSVMAHGTKFP